MKKPNPVAMGPEDAGSLEDEATLALASSGPCLTG